MWSFLSVGNNKDRILYSGEEEKVILDHRKAQLSVTK